MQQVRTVRTWLPGGAASHLSRAGIKWGKAALSFAMAVSTRSTSRTVPRPASSTALPPCCTLHGTLAPTLTALPTTPATFVLLDRWWRPRPLDGVARLLIGRDGEVKT